MIYSRAIFTLALIGALANCGGGGGGGGSSSGIDTYSGNVSAATASEDNKGDLADAARYGTSYAIENDGQDVSVPFKPGMPSADIKDIIDNTLRTAAETQQSPVGFQFTEDCGSSGSMTIDFVGVSQNATTIPTNGTIIAYYDNCSEYQGDFVIDGTMRMEYTGFSQEQGFYQTYTVSFNLTYDGNPYTGVISCTNYGETCTFNQDFTIEGVSYRVEDSSVSSGSTADAYNVSATIYHEEEGSISIVAEDVTIDANGNVCSGTISVYDSSSDVAVITVDFPDCSTFTLTYNGVSETYSQ